MLELGDNIKYSVHLEVPPSSGPKIEVQFPTLYYWVEDPDWHWWVTELDQTAGKWGQIYSTFYTQGTLGQLLCREVSPSTFVIMSFEKEANVWTANMNI